MHALTATTTLKTAKSQNLHGMALASGGGPELRPCRMDSHFVEQTKWAGRSDKPAAGLKRRWREAVAGGRAGGTTDACGIKSCSRKPQNAYLSDAYGSVRG